jgi:preprotein translocase subunit SecB
MKIKAIHSDLQMVKFAITEMQLSYIRPAGEDWEDAVTFEDYSVAFDLDARHRPEHPDEFYFFMEVWINQEEKPLPGYKIYVAGNGLFRIAHLGTKDKETLHNLQVISPASLMVNTLRSAISDATSYSVLGRYNLPAIDILSLIRAKADELVPKVGHPPKKRGSGKKA